MLIPIDDRVGDAFDAAPGVARTRQTLFTLGTGFSAAHSMQLGALMASLAIATDDLSTAFWAFLIQQAIEPATELTTAYFADRRSRRLSVVLGFLALCASGFGFLVVTGFAPDDIPLMMLVALAQFCYLLGTSFISGALEAWAVDRLPDEARSPFILDELFTRLNLFKNFGIIAGGGLGLLLLTLTDEAWTPWLLFSCATALLGWASWRRMGNGRETIATAHCSETPAQALRTVVKSCRANFNLTIYIVGWALQYGFWGLLAYFWIPLLLIGLGAAQLTHWGWAIGAWLVWCLARVLAAAAAERLARSHSVAVEHIITVCAFATVATIVIYLNLEDQMSPLASVVCFFGVVLLSKVFEVAMTGLRMGRLNAQIVGPTLRATFISLGYAAGALVTLLTLGTGVVILGELPRDPGQFLWLLGIQAGIATLGAIVYGLQRTRSNGAVRL